MEVFNHDFCLLCDVVRMELKEPRECTGGFLALDVRVVLACFQKPEVGGVGRIVLQNA
jgi:hypothetical protein